MREPAAPPPDDEATGLPWPRSWRGVYALAFGVFVAWIVLLTILTQSFS